MADTETYRRVCAILGAKAGVEPRAIGPGQCIGEEQTPNFYDDKAFCKPLGLDSFDRIEVGIELEEEFGVKIIDDELDNVTLGHVGGLVAFVQGKLDARHSKLLERLNGPILPQVANGGGVPGFPLGKSGGICADGPDLRAAAHENGHKPDDVYIPSDSAWQPPAPYERFDPYLGKRLTDQVFRPGRHYLAGQAPDEAMIVNLAAERMKRDTNPQFVTQDDKGRDWFCFSAGYVDDEGREFSFRFWAQDMDDGYARLAAIKKTARMNGRLMDEIPDEA